MSNDKDAQQRANPGPAREPVGYEAPGWLSTEELEQELFMAVVGDTISPRAEADFQRIDAYFTADEPETEVEYRHSLLRLLVGLRPQLAELLGGPRTCA
jgi:hypothetical protein